MSTANALGGGEASAPAGPGGLGRDPADGVDHQASTGGVPRPAAGGAIVILVSLAAAGRLCRSSSPPSASKARLSDRLTTSVAQSNARYGLALATPS